MTEESAHFELSIMETLAKTPMSPGELLNCLQMPERRLKTVLANLRDADLIDRVPGTHLVYLREVS